MMKFHFFIFCDVSRVNLAQKHDNNSCYQTGKGNKLKSKGCEKEKRKRKKNVLIKLFWF